jgi:hypothetical protein
LKKSGKKKSGDFEKPNFAILAKIRPGSLANPDPPLYGKKSTRAEQGTFVYIYNSSIRTRFRGAFSGIAKKSEKFRRKKWVF